ncbi:Reverse transcriptase RNA-dependent DNA polymerase [Trinorchestia longiramus]|nr:Reverse transcriptase RNA-dependent DNA polymerase [Trinorchestia longiramus]
MFNTVESFGEIKQKQESDIRSVNVTVYFLGDDKQRILSAALDGHLKQLGFKQSKNDACIYTRVSNKGLCIIAVYVDDIIIASDCLDEINEVKSCLSAKYKMKDLGKYIYFLGVSVMQTKNEVFLEQSAYTKALLSRFGLDNANSVATPIDVNADLVTTSDEVEECDKDLYQSAVAESTTTAGRVNESTSVLSYDYLAVTLNESETLGSQKDTAGDFRLSVNSDVNGPAKDNPHTQAAWGTDFVESSCVDTMQEIVPVMARNRKSSRNYNSFKRIQCQGTDIMAAKTTVPLHRPLSSIGGLGITEENSQPADPIPVKLPSRNFKKAE